ncbi:hypothetical protein LCGC14_3041310, partial [marine sediment metagenome]
MSACPPPCEVCGHHHFPTDPCWTHSDDHVSQGHKPDKRPDAAPPKEHDEFVEARRGGLQHMKQRLEEL